MRVRLHSVDTLSQFGEALVFCVLLVSFEGILFILFHGKVKKLVNMFLLE